MISIGIISIIGVMISAMIGFIICVIGIIVGWKIA
jgi:hypothetical protein